MSKDKGRNAKARAHQYHEEQGSPNPAVAPMTAGRTTTNYCVDAPCSGFLRQLLSLPLAIGNPGFPTEIHFPCPLRLQFKCHRRMPHLLKTEEIRALTGLMRSGSGEVYSTQCLFLQFVVPSGTWRMKGKPGNVSPYHRTEEDFARLPTECDLGHQHKWAIPRTLVPLVPCRWLR